MRSIAFAVVVFACGGKPADSAGPPVPSNTSTEPAKPAGPQPNPYGGATYGGTRFDHTAQLKAFRDQIAPLTGPATAKRRTAACAASAKLAAAAKALSNASRPSGADPVWDGEADELESITEDLGPNCAAGDAGTIDFDIDSLHRSFQRLLKLAVVDPPPDDVVVGNADPIDYSRGSP